MCVTVLRFKVGEGWVMELLEKNFDMREIGAGEGGGGGRLVHEHPSQPAST